MRAQRGFTLIEMVVAMALTLVVFAITLPFVRVQSRALADNAGRLDAEQTARYAQRVIDEELRVAVADQGQPLMVYAGTMGIAFNANLVARDTLDPSALELDTSADSTLSEAWRVGQATTIPMTTKTYPTQTYLDGTGSPSRNETVMYYLLPDTVPGRSDIYMLFRRVNARPATLIVRNIHVPADSSFFRYFTMTGSTLVPIASASLPQYWDGTQAANIRAVGVRAGGFYRNQQSGEDVIRTINWTVMLANGAGSATGCGAVPGPPIALTWWNYLNSYPARIELAWDASTDDNAGAADVTHYLVERKRTTETNWQHIGSVPASRAASYAFAHAKPVGNGQYVYGIRAVDCGGGVSSRALRLGNVTVTLP